MSSNSMSSHSLSVVVASHNEGSNLRRTVHNLLASVPEHSEVIVVDDASTDNSAAFLVDGYSGVRLLRASERLGAVRGRNHGARAATGHVLVFADAHMETPLGWCEPLIAALQEPNVGAVAPAISVMGRPENKAYGFTWQGPDQSLRWLDWQSDNPHAVPFLPGAFLAMRRETFEAIGGFDDGLVLWGSEDAELSLRLWLLGYELRVVPQVEVAHLFRESHPYLIDWTTILHNMLRVALVHFNSQRIARVIEALKSYGQFASALAQTVASDVWTRRANLNARRVRDDTWFFDRFSISC